MNRNIVLAMSALVDLIERGNTIAPEDRVLFCTLRDQLMVAFHEVSRGLREEEQNRPSPLSRFERYQCATAETRKAEALREKFRCSSQRNTGLVKRITQATQAVM